MDPFDQDFVIKGGELKLGKKLTKELIDEYLKKTRNYGNVTTSYPTANPLHLITASIFNLFQARSKQFFQNQKIDIASIPIHGRFVGGNYSAGRKLKQGEKLTKSDLEDEPIDTVDSYAKSHDIAYNLALGLSDPKNRKKLISKADQVFILKTQATKINKLKLSIEIIGSVLAAYGFYKSFTALSAELVAIERRLQEIETRLSASITTREALAEHLDEVDRTVDAAMQAIDEGYEVGIEALEERAMTEGLSGEEIGEIQGLLDDAYDVAYGDLATNLQDLRYRMTENAAIIANLWRNQEISDNDYARLQNTLNNWAILSRYTIGGLVDRTYSSLLETASSAVFTYFLENEELRPNFDKLNLNNDDIKMYLEALKKSNNPLDQLFIDAFIQTFELEVSSQVASQLEDEIKSEINAVVEDSETQLENPPPSDIYNLPASLPSTLPPQVLAAMIALF